MRILGVQVITPLDVARRAVTDALAVERLVRTLPDQLEQGIGIGHELVDIGNQMLEIAERLDDRAARFNDLGERLDVRAEQLLELGQTIRDLGSRIDVTGSEIVLQSGKIVGAASDLISVLPTMERAVDLASPLGGAIDRFGRIVDRFPGGAPQRRREPVPDVEIVVPDGETVSDVESELLEEE